MRKLSSLCLLFVSFLYISSSLVAQDKVLTVDDYDRWSRIVGTELSDDGNWIAYGLRPNGGDDTLYVKSLSDDQVHSIPFAGNAEFSGDSRWVTYTIRPDEKTRNKLSEKGEKIFEKAQLLNLETEDKFTIERAGEVDFSENGRYWVVHREKPEADKSKHKGRDLILRNLEDGSMTNIGNVAEYAFNRRSDLLAYIVDADQKSGNGVYLKNLTEGTLKVLDSDSSIYSGLAWDDAHALRKDWNMKGRKLAVLKGHETDSLVHRANDLIVFENLAGVVKKSVFEPGRYDDFPQEMVISGNRDLSWSENGKMVFMGIRPQEPVLKLDRDTIPNVDVFHWNDDRIQTVQEQRAQRDRRFTWVAVFTPANGEFVRLTDEKMRELNFSKHARYMVGRDEKPYTSDINWGVSPADLYRVDLVNGNRTQFAKKVKRTLGYSPDGRYYLYQQVTEQDTSLIVYDLQENKNTNISAPAPVHYMDLEHPYPHESPPYGIAGWTKDQNHVIVNHEYDLWMLALDGSEAVDLTRGMGEKEQIIFRYETLDDEEEYIDTSKPMLLEAFGEWTKRDGFYRFEMGRDPNPLLFEDANFGNVEKARMAGRVILTKQTFVDFPDYYMTDTDFKGMEKITDANPQQSEYAWGRRVLVEYENSRGIKLQGTLTLPANYEKGKRYPMIVYFYEKMSDRHHQYSMPVYDDRPHMSTYASNGYLVFMPDNVYEVGKPGTSSLDCITSATQKVIDLGYADPGKIGLQGHSWGGYQSSFILTQTDMFATVVTGAPPTNLPGFYNNIYGSTGTNHHGIMEIGQVRMGRGVTPWTHRETYNREDPMYHVPDIEVPFMILHGTEDGAVDYMQGLEFYNAARRMGKEVVLLTYPGEGHHLRREANQKDFLVRMQLWFDHYVKGEPAPEWMKKGIPYLEKLWNKAEGN